MFNSLPTKTEKVYTILELNTAVRQIIKSEFPEYIWVCGEIKDLKISKDKRHIYFELIQKHPEADEIIAKVNAAIFESKKPLIFERINQTNGAFELKNDIEVKFLCEVDLYPKSGQYNLVIVDIDPVYTLGKFAQNRERIIEDLRKRGLLDKNKQLPFPNLPLNIGLITAFDSAAYHDFIHELKISGYGFKIFVYDCYMQGRSVESTVVEALNFFNKFRKEELDLVVITRGGGSTADLSWFDNKRIAEAISHSRLPVITALGHHINITVADFVSHTSLKTPTKAAQFIVERINLALEELNEISVGIVKETNLLLERLSRELGTRTLKIDSLVNRYFRHHREELVKKKSLIISNFFHLISGEDKDIKEVWKNLIYYLKKFFQNVYKEVDLLNTKINMLDPHNILKRGYSITFKGEKPVKSVEILQENDLLRTVFFEGEAFSRVREIKSRSDV
ncbi:MAG: exodeoxyribonuclease VII large subunit [Candidatus Omnitrophica bacterium]|nr:exodeoxyribonuclease VII large subunit [Candidatus Omnitrophota bacterium]MCM8827226.1 exodeoxyribonuclease VII large subunit [Candidatus Omnitrophota bacterium]